MLTILHGRMFFPKKCAASLNWQHKPVTLFLSYQADEMHFLSCHEFWILLVVLQLIYCYLCWKTLLCAYICMVIIFQRICVMHSSARGDYWGLHWAVSSSWCALCLHGVLLSWNADYNLRSCMCEYILSTGLFAYFLLCQSQTWTGLKWHIIQPSSSLGSVHS